MLLYPILEGYFNFAMELPTLLWGAVMIGLLILGFFGFREARNTIFTILISPIMLYFICYISKMMAGYPMLGILAKLVLLGVDFTVIAGIVMVIRYHTAK